VRTVAAAFGAVCEALDVAAAAPVSPLPQADRPSAALAARAAATEVVATLVEMCIGCSSFVVDARSPGVRIELADRIAPPCKIVRTIRSGTFRRNGKNVADAGMDTDSVVNLEA
jgi:hypothetical protein